MQPCLLLPGERRAFTLIGKKEGNPGLAVVGLTRQRFNHLIEGKERIMLEVRGVSGAFLLKRGSEIASSRIAEPGSTGGREKWA
jgi:hypothetical protein